MEKVITAQCESYDVATLKNLFYEGFREAGFKAAHQKVLLKPNLLSGKAPEKAVTTNPQFVQAVSELLLDLSCDVHIGDSPGYESTNRVLEKSGILDVVKRNGLKVATFAKKIAKKSQGISPYREFVLGEDPDDFEAIVNLPKLKTHMMMGLTLGVKNTFGFIHGMDKAKWHLRAGADKMLFASMLIDIHVLARPSITILDGIVGMDQDGPGSGRVRNTGIVALSTNAFTLDSHIEKLAGLPFSLPISSKARQHDMVPECEIVSLNSPISLPSDFQMPGTMATDWNFPDLAKRVLKNVFVKKPKVRKEICKGCGVCSKVCPAGALSLEAETPSFNYRKCIRCYCCQEMCPEGAIRV
jgi:uncharacterized protein (DUF362 family)/Pyruvate/2-oxoacid:ferredoxin oxidoreductase delta subunit